MKKRSRLSRSRSRRLFKKTALRTNKRNFITPMRGGMRM